MARARFAVNSVRVFNLATATSTVSATNRTDESLLIKELMVQARAKYAAHPELLSKIELPADIQEMRDFNDRLDAALENFANLLSEAKAQLAAPPVAPAELTPREVAELRREEEWDRMYENGDALNDAWLQKNDELFNEVTGLTEEFEVKGIAIPGDVHVPERPPTLTLKQMNVSEDAADWIRDSKQHLPHQPPKPSQGLEALKRTNSGMLSGKGRKTTIRGQAESLSDNALRPPPVTIAKRNEPERGVDAGLREGMPSKDFQTVCSWDVAFVWD